MLIYPSSAEVDDENITAQNVNAGDENTDVLGVMKIGKLERSQLLCAILGAVGGIGISLLAGLFSR